MSWWQRLVGHAEASPAPEVVLVVDDEPPIHDQVRSALADFGWEFAVAFDRESALAILARAPRLVTAIVDLYFPEDRVDPAGDGLDATGFVILAEVRRRYPGLRCAALTGGLRQHHINEIGRMDATYLSKWDLHRYLPHFGTKVLVARATSDETLRRCVSAYADQFRLSARETEVAALAAADVPRADLARRAGVKNTTVKSHISAVLEKTKARSIEAVGRTLRLQARAAEAARPAPGTRFTATYDGTTDTWSEIRTDSE